MRRGGWIMLDMLTALILLTITGGILAVGTYSEQVALRRLSDSRSASRAAEAALTAMQRGQTAPASSDVRIDVHVLNQSAGSPKLAWVEIKATVAKSTNTLVGLVPSSAVAIADGGGR